MKYIYILLFTLASLFAQAQEELSLFWQPNVVQSGLLMPAYRTDANFNIGFGSTYLHADMRGARLRDFSFKSDLLNNIAAGVSGFYFSGDGAIHLMDVGFNYKEWHIRAGYNTNMNAFFDFSPEFGQLLARGNGNAIGKTFDIGPDLYIRRTSELYLGASYQVYDYYSFGMNIKFVSGNFDLSTPKSNIALSTGEEIYDLTVNNDFVINSSYNSFDITLSELVPFSRPYEDNIGFSADFGFQYSDDKYDISVSLLDVGSLTWKSNSTNYTSNGTYTFSGFDFDDISFDTLEMIKDTLADVFNIVTTNESYRSYTPVKIILAGEYHMNKWSLGGMLYGEWKQNRFLPALGINLRRTIWNFWDFGISYAYKNNTFSNLGLSSVWNVGPFQVYAMTDNVFGVLIPVPNTKINIRAGANLRFGRKKKKKAIEGQTASM